LRLLFDVAHPAHVHLFRHLIARVRSEGGSVLVAAREKDVTVELVRAFDIPHVVLSRERGGGLARNASELISRTLRLFGLARRFQPDALVGPSASFGLLGRLLRRPSFIFCEDDAAVVPRFTKLAYPLANWIVTPACLAFENYGKRQLTYPGYHELAYLHPAHFTPRRETVAALGLAPGEPYFIVRLVALRGHHDAEAGGLTTELARRLVALLAERGRVLVTAEGPLDPALEPYRFPLPPEALHDVLAFASMCVGDSQTLIAEAAVLGVPNLRCNSFVGRIAYLEELEHKWGLSVGIPVQDAERMLTTASTWLADLKTVKSSLGERRKAMLESCVDVSAWQWTTLHDKLGSGLSGQAL
jgi:predicted glycosyltransferase